MGQDRQGGGHQERTMKKILAGALAGVLLLATVFAAAQSLKIGFVNTARIERESAQAQRANEAMKKEFEPRERQIIDLQQQIKADQERFEKGRTTMPPAELKALGASIASRMRESDHLVYTMTADIEQRRKERAGRLLEDARAAIKSIAEGEKYDLIVHEAAFARSAIDLTDRVLKEMARRTGN
jgi:outer membrane protein